MDRTNLSIAISQGDWGRKDYRAEADPTQPVLFTDVRLVFIDDWGGFYYPLIGDIIEKTIPDAEFFAPLIHGIHTTYTDLVQLETQGDMGKILEINANVVTWPCVAGAGAPCAYRLDCRPSP
jgi:hypothetical protein